MSSLKDGINGPWFKAHPDDEGIDRIEIIATPRYKQSGLSGDEWRVGARILFYRKGRVVAEEFRTSMKYAILCLGQLWATVPESSDIALWRLDADTCAQFGCPEKARFVKRIKEEYSRQGDGPLPDKGIGPHVRAFCLAHARRGDCGLEDADANYENFP